MIEILTQLVIGFSIVAASILLLCYLFALRQLDKTVVGRVACATLLVVLIGLQIAHLQYFRTGLDVANTKVYALMSMTAPPAFFLFSRDILLPGSERPVHTLMHLIPVLLAVFLPPGLVMPVAFAIGTAYTIWIAKIVFGMRRNVARFKFEMFFFGLFAITAVVVLAVVLLSTVLNSFLYYVVYANAIGLSFVLIVAALLAFPDLLTDIGDVAQLTYAKSTLNDVDVDASLKKLGELMGRDKVFRDEELNLGMAADAMGLNAHQLSELVNRHLGVGFSRYVREQRIAEAKRLLREDPRSSVLSIGMTTGFKSQSSFYAAFREIVGEAPGAYRKRSTRR